MIQQTETFWRILDSAATAKPDKLSENLPSRHFVRGTSAAMVLAFLLAAACFWSTAAVEILAALLLVSSVVRIIRPFNLFSQKLASHFADSKLKSVSLIFWFIYEACILLSYFFSGTPLTRHPGWIWHPFIFLIPLIFAWDEKTQIRMGTVFLISGATASVTSIIATLIRQPQKALFTFIGLSTFANLMAFAGIVGIALFLSDQTERGIRFRISTLVFCAMMGIFWTAERAPVLALVCIGGLIIGSTRPRFVAIWITAVAVCLALSPNVLLGKFQFLIQRHLDDRTIVWTEGLKLARHVPLFGYGPDCYLHVLPSEAWHRFINKPPGSWHNDFLQTTLDSGPFAAAALVGLILLILVSAALTAFRWRKDSNGRQLSVLAILLGACSGFSLIGGVFSTAILGCVFWLLLGFTLQKTSEIARPN